MQIFSQPNVKENVKSFLIRMPSCLCLSVTCQSLRLLLLWSVPLLLVCLCEIHIGPRKGKDARQYPTCLRGKTLNGVNKRECKKKTQYNMKTSDNGILYDHSRRMLLWNNCFNFKISSFTLYYKTTEWLIKHIKKLVSN